MNLMDPDGMQPNSNFTYGSSDVGTCGDLSPYIASPNSGAASAGGGFGAAGIVTAGITAVSQFSAANKAFSNWRNVSSQSWAGLNIGSIEAPSVIQPNATISQWQPGLWDNLKAGGFLGKFTYDIIDQPYVAVHSIFWPFSTVRHLNSDFATPHDMQTAVVMTAAAFIPIGKSASVGKEVLENVAENGVIDATKGGTTALIRTGITLSDHAIERVAGRESGVTKEMVETVLEKGERFYDPQNKSIVYILRNGFASGKSLLVATNPLTGSINTIIKGILKKLIRPRFIPIK